MHAKLISFFMILSYCFTMTQPVFSQTSLAQPVEFDHIALHVRDLEKSAEFYLATIGLEQVADPFKDGKHAFFRLSKHSQLHLIAGAPGDVQHDIDVHFALRLSSVTSFCTMLEQKHIKYFNSKREDGAVTTRPDGIRQIYFQDPDGYWIEVNDSRL
jgi:lactoylglutathione lyase